MYRVQFKHGAVEKEFDLDKKGAFDAAYTFLQDRTLLGGPVEMLHLDTPEDYGPYVFDSYLETISVMRDDNRGRKYGTVLKPQHIYSGGTEVLAKYVEPGVRYTETYLWDNLAGVGYEHEHLITPLYHCVGIPEDFVLLGRSDPELEGDNYYRVYRRGARSLVLVYCGDCCGEDCIFIVQFDPA